MLSAALLVRCGAAPVNTSAPETTVEPLPVLTSLTVQLSSNPLVAGERATATVQAVDHKGRAMTVGAIAWTTAQSSVATVSSDGVVSAVAPGTTTLSARVGTVQGSLSLTVQSRPPGPAPVASVVVSPFSATLEAGQSMQLDVAVRDYAGTLLTGRAVLWNSSAPTVAMVSATGLVTALSSGTVIVDASSETQHAATALTVTIATDTDIVVNVPIPFAYAVVGDTVTAVAAVTSRFPLTGVIASVGGQVTPLQYGPIGGAGARGNPMGWTSRLNLATLPYGPYALIITATDERGHQRMSAVPIIRNPTVLGGTKGQTASK